HSVPPTRADRDGRTGVRRTGAARALFAKLPFKLGKRLAQLPRLVQSHVFSRLAAPHSFQRLSRDQQLVDVVDRQLHDTHAGKGHAFNETSSLKAADGLAERPAADPKS